MTPTQPDWVRISFWTNKPIEIGEAIHKVDALIDSYEITKEESAVTQPDWSSNFEDRWHEATGGQALPNFLIPFIQSVAEQNYEAGYKKGLADCNEDAMVIMKNAVDDAVDTFRKRVEQTIEDYFKGLIVIPDPQATKESILEKIKNL